MRKLTLFALTAATVIAASGSTLSIQASAGNFVCKKLQKDNRIVIGKIIKNKGDLKDMLCELEKELGNYNWNNCIPDIIIPDTESPEVTQIPEVTKVPQITQIPEQDDSAGDNSEVTFAEQVTALVNKERAKAGLGELTLDKTIEKAAFTRAKEITRSFSHTRPDGSNFSSVLKEHGITYRGSGENIAWGQKSPEEVMKAWMNSEGHRANILNPNFKKIGVGHYQNEKGTNYWAQLFTY